MNILRFLDENRRATFIVVGLGVASGAAWYYACQNWRNKQNKILPSEWEEVGTVTELHIYPIKSAKPISVKSAEATSNGLADGLLLDRSFVVIRENGRMVTGRESGILVTLATEFKNSKLKISALNKDEISIDLTEILQNNKIIKFLIRGDPVQGVDCGNPVAEWLSQRLFENEEKVRLMYVGKETWQRPSRSYDFFKFPTFWNVDTTSYNDTSSYGIMTEASLRDLNSRLETPVSMLHFRSPIVIGGTKPYDEDDWEFMKIGETVILHLAKPTHRCLLITVNPETGKRSTEHFEELKKYRIVDYPKVLAKTWATHPILGLNCGIDVVGRVNVGDKVSVSRATPPYWHVRKNPSSA